MGVQPITQESYFPRIVHTSSSPHKTAPQAREFFSGIAHLSVGYLPIRTVLLPATPQIIPAQLNHSIKVRPWGQTDLIHKNMNANDRYSFLL